MIHMYIGHTQELPRVLQQSIYVERTESHFIIEYTIYFLQILYPHNINSNGFLHIEILLYFRSIIHSRVSLSSFGLVKKKTKVESFYTELFTAV